MTAEWLMRYFEQLADAPDAVPRLRLLVRDLAVAGRLVRQDDAEGQASSALSGVSAERQRRIDSGDLRPSLSLRLAGNEMESDYPVPVNWEFCYVDDLAIKVTDGEHATPLRNTSGRYLLSARNVTDRGIDLSDVDFVPESEYERIRRRCDPDQGDILVSCSGSVGRVAVVDESDKYVMVRSVALIKLDDELLSPAYLACALRSGAVQRQIREYSKSTAQANLFIGAIRRLRVPVPPVLEQHRIVAKVDELMAVCDELEAAQAKREERRGRLVAATLHGLNNGGTADSGAPMPFNETARFYFNHLPRLTTRPEHIQQLRQTILNLAVRGKLVPQDSNEEPASAVFKRLQCALAEHREINSGRTRPAICAGGNEISELDTFPSVWVRTNFDTVNAIASGVAKGKDLRAFRTVTCPYLRVANVQRGYLDLSVVKEIQIRADEFDRYHLRKGDVLMTEGGDWDKLGRAAIWDDSIQRCIHQNHVFRIRPANPNDLLPDWLVLVANSQFGRSYFERASKQTTNLASINMTQLRSCPLPLPPLSEQHRIVAKVDELMALCDELERRLASTASTRLSLLEATLQQALAYVCASPPQTVGKARLA